MIPRLFVATASIGLSAWTYLKVRPPAGQYTSEGFKNRWPRIVWPEVTAICAIVAGFLCVQIPAIRVGFQYDELYTVTKFVLGKSLWYSASVQSVFNNHFANSIQMNLVSRVLGTSEAALRLPSLFWGTVSIAMTWMIIRIRAGIAAGLLSSMVVAAAPLFALLSRQARGYSGLVAMTLISLYCLLQILGGNISFRMRACHTAALALGVYFHLYGMWAVISQYCLVGWISMRGSKARGLREVWDDCALGGVLSFLLYLPVMIEMCLMWSGRGRTPVRWSFPNELVRELGGGLPLLLGAAVLVFCVVGGLRIRRGELIYLLLWLSIPALLVWLLLRPKDLYPRFFVFWIPPLCYLITRGVLAFAQLFRHGRVGKFIAGSACAVAAASFTAWIVSDVNSRAWDYRASTKVDAGISRQFVAGADSEILSYYLPRSQRVRLAELDRALSNPAPMQVAYHSVDWQGPEEESIIAKKLRERCDFSQRDWIIVFTCNQDRR